MIDINKYDKILIIGYPGSGKSTYFNSLPDSDHFRLKTDDYLHLPYVEQLYIIMGELRNKDKWIVEGVQGYRMLRKYAQLGEDELKPDVIVITDTNRPVLAKHKGMRKGLNKVWEDYEDLEPDLPETIVEFNGD